MTRAIWKYSLHPSHFDHRICTFALINKEIMASIRQLKKEVKGMVYDVIEEAYRVQLYSPEKKEKADQLIDEAVAFFNEAITKINAADSKKEFQTLVASFEQKGEDWVDQLNAL
jgi:hypothetical protein